MKNKIPFDKSEIIFQLKEAIDELENLCTDYDSGKPYIRSIAIKLRVIFHSGTGKSLLRLCKLEHIKMFDTAGKYNSRNLLEHFGLTHSHMKFDNGVASVKIVAPLHDVPTSQYVSLQNWWDGKSVIVDNQKNTFKRKDLVLAMANNDGGGHVDENGLLESYKGILNKVQWVLIDKYGERPSVNNQAFPSVRQIAFEAIHTLTSIDLFKESKLPK